MTTTTYHVVTHALSCRCSVKKRGAEYDAQKKKLMDQMRCQVEHFFPQVADKIEYMDASTPVTSKYYLSAQSGESYGLAMSKERFEQKWLKPQTPIRGLFLAGQGECTWCVGCDALCVRVEKTVPVVCVCVCVHPMCVSVNVC
jgi:phytoene dehydrogenase-like protein